jgi:glycosyltransferase involved in cell wall biosynthesis
MLYMTKAGERVAKMKRTASRSLLSIKRGKFVLPKKKKRRLLQQNKLQKGFPANEPLGLIVPETPLSYADHIPLRVLMVIDQFNVGGTETYTLSLCRELIRKGVSVVVAGKKGNLMGSFIGLGCPVYDLEFVSPALEAERTLHGRHIDMLKAIIASERIDIVHCHQAPSGCLALEAAKQMNTPVVFTVHGTYYETGFLNELRHDASVIAVSPSVQRFLETIGIGSRVISNGVDPVEYDAYDYAYRSYMRDQLGIPDSANVILYAGRLAWEKADICEEVIRAVARMQQDGNDRLRLIIAGGGQNQDKIRTLALNEENRVKRQFVSFMGEVLHIRGVYAVSDCVIGTGRVGLEAMACRCPFICAGSKGFLGIVRPDNYREVWDSWFGDHGFDSKPLQKLVIEQITSIFTMEEQEKRLLVQSGRNFVKEHFHISRTAEQILDVYRQVAGTRRSLSDTRIAGSL